MNINMTHWNLHNKWVLVRIDGNVPLEHGTITDDYRLKRVLPTLDALITQGGRLIVLTHVGRPKDHEPSLSTKPLVTWFAHYYKTIFAPTLQDITTAQQSDAQIIMLENLRFFSGEKGHDSAFARELASHATYYVNDAFGSMHRNDTSLTLLAQQFSPENRSIGLLTQQEISMLTPLLEKREPGTVFILGGGKPETKIPLIGHLLKQACTVAVCPALSFTFNKAQGIDVGSSLVDDALVADCHTILTSSTHLPGTIMMPLDYQIAQGSLTGPLSHTSNTHIPAGSVGISIGPKSIALIEQLIDNAPVVFFNGAMGFVNRPESMLGTRAVLEAMNACSGITILAGGDTVAYAQKEGLTDHITHLSTGGGATLSYLSGTLFPGLEILKNRTKAE